MVFLVIIINLSVTRVVQVSFIQILINFNVSRTYKVPVSTFLSMMVQSKNYLRQIN